MGIYDILSENKLSYDQLVNILYGLSRCVFLDAGGIVNQLDKIYNDAEYKRDFGPEKHGVWVVRQTQPCEYYQDKPIAVFDNKEQAQKLSRALNKEYGFGVRFDEDGDYIESDDDFDFDDQHYYDLAYFEINPDLSIFGVNNK